MHAILAIQSTFRSLEIHFNRHLFISVGHPRATWVFSKLSGLQYYFPENFRCNLKFYESEISLIPLSIGFSIPKISGYFIENCRWVHMTYEQAYSFNLACSKAFWFLLYILWETIENQDEFFVLEAETMRRKGWVSSFSARRKTPCDSDKNCEGSSKWKYDKKLRYKYCSP